MGVIAPLAAITEAAVLLPACHLPGHPADSAGSRAAGTYKKDHRENPLPPPLAAAGPISPPAATAHGTAMS